MKQAMGGLAGALGGGLRALIHGAWASDLGPQGVSNRSAAESRGYPPSNVPPRLEIALCFIDGQILPLVVSFKGRFNGPKIQGPAPVCTFSMAQEPRSMAQGLCGMQRGAWALVLGPWRAVLADESLSVRQGRGARS